MIFPKKKKKNMNQSRIEPITPGWLNCAPQVVNLSIIQTNPVTSIPQKKSSTLVNKQFQLNFEQTFEN